VRFELPKPEVRWARLDHDKTRMYDLHSKAWPTIFPILENVRDEAMRRAQQVVKNAVSQHEDFVQAQRQTESVLTTFHAASGFRAEIVWLDAAPAVPVFR